MLTFRNVKISMISKLIDRSLNADYNYNLKDKVRSCSNESGHLKRECGRAFINSRRRPGISSQDGLTKV